MRRSNHGLYMVLLLGMASCITSYDPLIEARDEMKYVVNAQILAGENVAKANITITSPLDDPHYIPVTDCKVDVFDNLGHSFRLEDIGNGNYERDIDPSNLQPGTNYWMEIETPQGDIFRSATEILTSSASLDSVYYKLEEHESNAGNFSLGIQFYEDFAGGPEDSKFYRWEPIETWEYHADYPLEWYYDGQIRHVFPPDYSKKVCWRTLRIPQVFNLSMVNLTANRFKMYPLHFVSNTTSRLAYGYSLLVKQYSLTESAYTYYDQLRILGEQEGGLYEKQPLRVKGNFVNSTHPETEVLGYFSASTVVSRRIFVEPIPDLPLNFSTFCDPYMIRTALNKINPKYYPIYLQGDSTGRTGYLLDAECVNCLTLGGTNIKPSFWPH